MAASANAEATIAIVEDDRAVRDSLVALIGAHGFNVRDFALGRDFLNTQDARAADCLVIDNHLPDMTGLEVVNSLRDRGDPTPAILITGFFDSIGHAKGGTLGVAAVLYKPIGHWDLLDAIRQALVSEKR
jgi:FixJ family two-component response regulator